MSHGTILTKGTRVEVNRGPRLGTQGWVFWTDPGEGYGGGYRVAVKATEELFWIDANALDTLGELAPIHNVIQHRAVHLTSLPGRAPIASPEGRYLLLEVDGGHALFDLILSGKELARIENLQGCRLAVSPSGDRLALKASSDEAVARWGEAIVVIDLRGRVVTQQLDEHRLKTVGDVEFEELVFTADGRCLVHFGELESPGSTSVLALYSAHDLRQLSRWEGPGRPALEISLHVDPYHPELLLLFESSSEGEALLRIFQISFEGGVVEHAALPEQGEIVISAGFSERGDTLMMASDAGVSAWSWPRLERLWGPREAPRGDACPDGTWATLEGGFVRDRFALTVVEEEQERAVGLLLLNPRNGTPIDLLDIPRSDSHAELCLHLGHGRVAICGKSDIEVYLIPALSDAAPA